MLELIEEGKKEREDGAVMNGMVCAAQSEFALMTGDDSGGDPEAEAGPVQFLGCVKRLKDPAADSFRHTMTGVRDDDADTLAWVFLCGVIRAFVRTDDEPAALAHGVDRICDQIIEHLTNIVFETENGRRSCEVRLDLNTRIKETSVIEVEDGIYKVFGGNERRADCLAMEAEGLGRNLSRPSKARSGRFLTYPATSAGRCCEVSTR